ncbi:MAG: hypothetical protein HQK54_15365 [Oligoflexales bacterium]|nr:hypothetical protein [Oligoflexales bacterium]
MLSKPGKAIIFNCLSFIAFNACLANCTNKGALFNGKDSTETAGSSNRNPKTGPDEQYDFDDNVGPDKNPSSKPIKPVSRPISSPGGAGMPDGNFGEPVPAISPAVTPAPVWSSPYVAPTSATVYPTGPVSNGTNSGTPVEVVDGMEVYTNCDNCVYRAKQLSPQCGFTANISRTINLGFYKVDPSRGLCDIHFMANMDDEISDHEGRDSILGNQIALYCPCNCGWAENEAEDGYDEEDGWYGYDEEDYY